MVWAIGPSSDLSSINTRGDMSLQEQAAPRASLSSLDGVAIIVGLVIGVGIFKAPQLVAGNVGSEAVFIGVWLAGGLVTLIGGLVYAELAAAFPSTGGEYRFLTRALGREVGFMFAWARTTVIQTGAIAAVSFVFGDYAQQLLPLGPYGPALYAGLGLVLLTLINLAGTFEGKTTQNIFTVLEVAAVLFVALVGLAFAQSAAAAPAPAQSGGGAIGLAMVFILLTYGGWNEAAYLSRDLRNVGRDMVRVLVTGTVVVTALYLVVNLAYLHVLGLAGMSKSSAVAADVMRAGLGGAGAFILSLIICCAALSTMNATIFTGARLYHALGEDLSLRALSFWSRRGNNPRNAIILQSAITLALILFGAVTRDGFQAMVEYTAPVFWFFLLLVGISFFVLRYREPDRERPFRVPLYPVVPAIFVLTCAYLLYASLAYTGTGALVGVAVLLLGVPLLFVIRRRSALPAE
jgi:amino acid transporter